MERLVQGLSQNVAVMLAVNQVSANLILVL